MSANPAPAKVEWKGGPWPKGYCPNPSARRKGEVYISEAVRALLAGDEPSSAAPVWGIARNVLRALQDERLDSRLLNIVLERIEGKVPDRLEATVNAGVVLMPLARLEADAWGRLAQATLGPRSPAIDAEIVETARELEARATAEEAPEVLPDGADP